MERQSQKEIIEKNIKLFFNLSIASYLVSTLFTISLMKTNAKTFFSIILLSLMAILIDVCKGFCFHFANDISLDKKHRSSCKKIGAFLLIISVLASLSFMHNESNAVKNENYTKSLEYQNYLEKKEMLNKQKNLKENEIKNLEKLEGRTKKSYITRKTNFLNEIDIINEKLMNLTPPKDIKTKNEKGFIATCEFILKYVKFINLDAEELNTLIFVYIGILSELVGVMFSFFRGIYMKKYKEKYGAYYIDFEEKNTNASNEEKAMLDLARKELAQKQAVEKIIDFQQEKALNKAMLEQIQKDEKKNEIGFKFHEKKEEVEKSKKEKYSNENFVNYYNFMVADAEEKGTNISKGYKAIAKEIEIKESEAQKIKNAMEMQGIIETRGNQTVILKMNENMKKAI